MVTAEVVVAMILIMLIAVDTMAEMAIVVEVDFKGAEVEVKDLTEVAEAVAAEEEDSANKDHPDQTRVRLLNCSRITSKRPAAQIGSCISIMLTSSLKFSQSYSNKAL
jgi:hypothetical protein